MNSLYRRISQALVIEQKKLGFMVFQNNINISSKEILKKNDVCLLIEYPKAQTSVAILITFCIILYTLLNISNILNFPIT